MRSCVVQNIEHLILPSIRTFRSRTSTVSDIVERDNHLQKWLVESPVMKHGCGQADDVLGKLSESR